MTFVAYAFFDDMFLLDCSVVILQKEFMLLFLLVCYSW
jgi:hypothetical protein